MGAKYVDKLHHDFPGGVVNPAEFEVKGLMGTGELGRVHEAIYRRTQQHVAIKELFTDEGLTPEMIEDFCREIRVLYTCRYPFVLGIIGFTTRPPFCIVIPFVEGGSLFDYVRSSGERGRLDPTQKTLIAAAIAYGMGRLHDANIIHRNLKSRNILLDSRMLPFISDFGVARTVDGKNMGMTRDCGTANWAAPELMESHAYDNKVDVYSFGGILYELLCNQIPFEGLSATKIALEVTRKGRPPIRDAKEKKIVKLIKKCWEHDPQKRPAFRDICERIIGGKDVWDGTNPKGLAALKKLIKDAVAAEVAKAKRKGKK